MWDQLFIALPLIFGAYLTLSLLKLPAFSLESAYLCGAVMAYGFMDAPFPVMLLSALAGGAIVGAVVFVLNQTFKVPFLLAAILTNGLFHGLTQWQLGTALKSFHPVLIFSETSLFLCIALALSVVMGLLLRTQWGHSLAIYGQNPLFFRHHAASERYVVCSGVVVGHALAGLGGFLFALSSSLVDLTMNFGILLFCLTALILGRALVRTHRPTLLIPLAGLVLYFCLQQALLHVGLNLKYFNAFQALLVLGALCLARRKNLSLDHLGV